MDCLDSQDIHIVPPHQACRTVTANVLAILCVFVQISLYGKIHTCFRKKTKRGGCSCEHPPLPGKPAGGESLRKVLRFRRPMGRQGRALYACSLPEETYDTLVDSLGLAKSRNTSLLHDLETGHLRCFMGVVRIHDLA